MSRIWIVTGCVIERTGPFAMSAPATRSGGVIAMSIIIATSATPPPGGLASPPLTHAANPTHPPHATMFVVFIIRLLVVDRRDIPPYGGADRKRYGNDVG